MLKHKDNESTEPSTVSQDAVDRLRQLTDAGIGADLNTMGGRKTDSQVAGQRVGPRISPVKVACSLIVVLSLGAAVIWPKTANMATSQLKMLGGINSLAIFQGTESERIKERAFIAAHPDDATIQFGGALRGNVSQVDAQGAMSSQERAEQLRSVAAKFPDHPEILAATLRAESQGEVLVHRADAMQFLENRPAPKTGTVAVKQKVSDAAAVKRFIDQCLLGERADPDNAYFPLLRAMAFTELRQDKAAFAALKVASTKPLWREYIPEEFIANRTVNRAMYGKSGLIPEMAISAAILFPHYSSMRELSRVVAAEAIRMEMQGRFAEGMALRRDLFDVSEKVRNQSTTMIGSLVGGAMLDTSRMRPGGMLPVKAKQTRNDGPTAAEAKVARDTNRKRFVDFATKHGEAAFAKRVIESAKLGDAIRETSQRGTDRGVYGLELITRLVIGQGVGLILLSNLVWMLILGAITAAVVRSPRFVAGNRLAPGPFVASVAGIALAMVVSGAVTGMSVGYTVGAMNGMTGEAGSILPMAAIAAGLVLALPTLLTVILSIWAALNKRASFTRTITGGFAVVALPAAALMALAWVGVVYYSAGLDAQGSAELVEMLQHEGKYLFRIMGKKWPI
jgi:hypothetical protein